MIKVTLEFNTLAEMIAHFGNSTAHPSMTVTQQHTPNIVTSQPGTNNNGPSATTEQHNEDNGPANANAPATDTQGMPWDERIHSAKKGLNTDGSWRKRRGVDAAFVATVENELRQRGAQQSGMYMQQQPQPGPGPQNYQPQPQQYQQPGPSGGGLDFNGFMQHVMSRMHSRDANGQPFMDHNYLVTVVQRINAQFGKQYGSITDIAADPQAWAFAEQCMRMDNRW